jgi:hypothetical protein
VAHPNSAGYFCSQPARATPGVSASFKYYLKIHILHHVGYITGHTPSLHYKDQLVNAIYGNNSKNYMTHISTLFGQDAMFLMLKQAVHILTNAL